MNKSFPAIFALALFLSVLLFNYAAAQSTVQERIKQVENNLTENLQTNDAGPMNLQKRMEHYKVNGLSIAVIKDYKIDWVKAYGVADAASKIPVTDQTLFQAASISKSLNAVGVMKLFKSKHLDLFADINTYLSSWKFPYDSLSKGKKINTANLLSHTAGLSVHGFGGYEPGTPLPSVIQILNGTKPANSGAVRSVFEPGIRQQYSGGGTTITQLMVTDISKERYEKYMSDQVLKPMGMLNSTFAQSPAGLKRGLLATGYDVGGKEVKGKYHIYPEQAPAGLWTNPADLARYIIETQLAYEGRSAKVLDQETTKLRLTPYMNAEAALGVFIEDYNGLKYFGHGGANEGFRSGYYGSLAGGNGLVIMVNSDNGEIIQELINSIATVYDFKGLNKTEKIKLANVSEKDLDSYLGDYQLTPKLVLTITREGKQVYAQATGQSRIEAFAETSSKFFFKVIHANMEFVKDDQGKVTKMIFNQGGRIEAKKL
ncbi:MAG TPA: serine hydrolase [Pedobacter sp.]|uniref:serine hydrolase n=1 Tax=Pedobacter sp. TaxID=1411316 RepID=UPI002CB6E307|nr:serine hydrolase [Pedobacter sp.]HMI04561.1 serine hydrolase [Pedobacter sp.]